MPIHKRVHNKIKQHDPIASLHGNTTSLWRRLVFRVPFCWTKISLKKKLSSKVIELCTPVYEFIDIFHDIGKNSDVKKACSRAYPRISRTSGQTLLTFSESQANL